MPEVTQHISFAKAVKQTRPHCVCVPMNFVLKDFNTLLSDEWSTDNGNNSSQKERAVMTELSIWWWWSVNVFPLCLTASHSVVSAVPVLSYLLHWLLTRQEVK